MNEFTRSTQRRRARPLEVAIYRITSPTNKVYIGQSIRLYERLRYYALNKCVGQHKIHASIKKHGWDKHIVEVLHHLPCDTPQSVLDDYEILYINTHKACGFTMLNIAPGGGGTGHQKLSVREKLRAANLGKKGTPEMREKLRQANLGRVGSGMTGKKQSENCLRKMSERAKGKAPWNKGTKLSDEGRAKLSEAAKTRTFTEEGWKRLIESRRKTIPWNKGVPQSAEAKAKYIASQKGKKRGPQKNPNTNKILHANIGD